MVDIGGGIKKPFSDMKILLISTIIGAIPFVGWLLYGYGLKTAESTIKGDEKLPSWGEFVDILVKTILGIIIFIIYLLPGLIIVGVGLGPLIGGILGGVFKLIFGGQVPDIMGQAVGMIIGGGILILLGLLLLFIAGLILPMALMFFLGEGSFGAAFSFGKIIKKCLSGPYIIALVVSIVWGMVVGFVLSIVLVAVLLIPVIGFILVMLVGGLANYLLWVPTYTWYAQAYKETK